ncbi:MAG TPA: ABC transporter ATP-binding protein [Patescibacteria group bacterium]
MSIIEFKSVTKHFHLQQNKTFKDLIPALIRGQGWAQSHTVLKNVSFSIRAGESVAIVGKNGAGKSTILKLIAGVTYPSQGQVIVRDQVAPLIELGAGFHHELSGYENIFLNSAILGLHRKEIEAEVDDIIAFSELAEFIHEPVKRYSTGMTMRLAFSVAAHTTAPILLVDEVLAVGDYDFQQKCLRKLQEFKKEGRTIIFVSHDEQAITEFCERALLLHQGKLDLDGTPDQVLARYHQLEDAKE